MGTLYPQSGNCSQDLFQCLSYSHFQELVEYALAGMDNKLFVSKYQVELPGKEEIRQFIEEQIRNEGDAT